jgi:hypothetical protein
MPAVLYTKIETETVLNYAIFPNEAPSPGSQAPQAIVATRPMGLYVSPLTNYPIAYLDSTGTYVFTNIAEGLSEDLEPPPQYLAIAKSESDAAYVAAPVGRP